MGNELTNEYIDKEPKDYESDCIRYGVICQKWGEKTNDDSYLSLPDQSISDKDKTFNYSLFGVFDGHNSSYISEYLSVNIQKLFEKEISTINKDNYKTKIEEIFKSMDKELRGDKQEPEQKQKEDKASENKENKENEENKDNKEDKENKENKENNNIINENKDETQNSNIDKKEEINYIDVRADEKEINIVKNTIKDIKDLPDELKEVDDSDIEDLLIFKNLFRFNNNYLYNNNNPNYIGSSASMVLINDDYIIAADLGITKCILLNKDGSILNIKDIKDNKNFKNANTKDFNDKDSKSSKDAKNTKIFSDSKILHTFFNLEEKKRIKKFNKTIDYQSLKINFYVPASRCFGFFKYKDNKILNEENQIISCVPDVYLYDKKDVDFILLLTKGAFSNGDNFNNFKENIKNIFNNKNKKLSELINEYVKNKKEEEKNKMYIAVNTSSSSILSMNKASNSIYVGKEDYGEDNTFINELNSTYYKDIMSLNKANNCNGNYNTTCILIQLLKKEEVTSIGDNELDGGNEKKSINEIPQESKDQTKNEDTIKKDEPKNDEILKEENNIDSIN
jgi:serine/threonine protein phosphatase PrpC